MATLSFKAAISLFLLATTFLCANSARILDEVDPQNPAILDPPPVPTTTTTLPSGQTPATAAAVPSATAPDEEVADPPIPDTAVPAAVAAPVADVGAPADDVEPPSDDVAPVTTPVTTTPPTVANGPGPATATTSATVANPTGPQPTTTTTTAATAGEPLSFYMHDVNGGSHPSTRVVTGIIARSDINGIPFSQPNNNIFPLQGATPLVNVNNINNLVNPNTAPLLTGLNGVQTSTVLQNANNNNNVLNSNNQPFVTAGQIPAGSALQNLMFGTITVIDDELTEGHELGSAVVGRAQGFYLASSLDGTSQTIALTVLLHNGDHGEVYDTISFFGVHRTASHESQIAIVGGSGKYENAGGYATVESLPHEDEHTTDGVDTVLHFSVYLSE